MSVYFIQAGDSGLVKIGCAQDPKKRLACLQLHNHEKLRLLRVMRGMREVEADLHHRFHEYRVRGEWFRLEGGLAEYVKKLPPTRKPREVSEQEALRTSRIGQAWFNLGIPSDAAAARSLRMDVQMLRRGLGPSGRGKRAPA
jgi:hypothetical protein